MPRSAIGFAAVICACLAGTGCLTDGDGFLHRGLFGEPTGEGWEKVKTPRDPKIPPAHLATTERVETLGRRIIAQNAFTGIEPMFFTLGVPESVLFHRGAEELFVSEGLVKQCKSEAELAAILCTELGQMMAEKRGTRRTGTDRDTIPESALPGGGSVAGGTRVDPGRDAELALGQRRPKIASATEPADPANLARELMKGAGFDPAELDRVEPLVKQSERGATLRKQMSNSAAPPTWNK